MALSRRAFIGRSLVAAAGLTVADWLWLGQDGAIGTAIAQTTPSVPEIFKVPPLPYAYDALQPTIDRETMEFHHDKHHAAYVKNLNTAIAPYPDLHQKSIEELISNLDALPADIRTAVRNNGGGHDNHSLFWAGMGPNAGGQPTGAIGRAITDTFGSFEALQTAFNQAGAKRFGSGWAWLVLDRQGKLAVTSTANQDSPRMDGQTPLLGNDVWEHAYYLNYRNRRDEYLKQWWNVVNWPVINQRYEAAKA
ncbi:MAG: superoxide dismutase [Oscillatoriales cyanobacterium]|nr:MAG: superoxide dismutase [Oscillatoriales cyanobacterium]